MILAIDPALRSCGVVILDYKGKVVKSEAFGYGLKGQSELEKIKRLLEISRKIILMGKSESVEFVGIEGLGISAKNGRFGNQIQLAELMGVIKTQVLLSLKIVPILVAPPSWKKEVIGNGRAKKPEIKKYLTQMGYILDCQDLYDAVGVGLHVLRTRVAGCRG